MDPTVLQVSQYLDFINNTFREHVPSQELLIEGEVSDFRIAQQKWVSFDLKDEEQQAVLKCFMTVWQLKVPLEDGMRVHVQGVPKIYERFGTFKMNVQQVSLVGEGALRRAYELLKKKLDDEGLFERSRKRALPRFPERVGLITSRDAAAYGDFLRILNNRWGGVSVQHTHVHVQGQHAVREILGAFAYFNQLPEEDRPDVLVMTRGGGGLEDLHAFNDEQVARAVFQSKIPVVCGIGHERDESLCDYVADVRASTPSNAAERIVPSRQDVAYELDTMTRHMEERLADTVERYAHVVDRVAQLVEFFVARHVEQVDRLSVMLLGRVDNWLPMFRSQLDGFHKMLRQIDPKRVLARGYGIIRSNGKIVTDTSTLEIGSQMGVQLAAGSLDAEVTRINGAGQQQLV